MSSRLACSIFLMAVAPLSATSIAQTPADEGAVINTALGKGGSGRYLEAEMLLRPLATNADGTPADGFVRQLWEQSVSYMTAEPPPVPDTLAAPDVGERAGIARIAAARPRDALSEIVARARRTRIVILNEDHGVPRSRAFALEVARALRPLGYTVLAAETFTNTPDPVRYRAAMATLASDGYPRRTTGTYLRDPVFADFVRQALALGYRPVAYEATAEKRPPDLAEQVAQREQEQTDNLVAHAVKAYPGDKILIYVGHSHVAEMPRDFRGRPMPWMAARLKNATGIDPLTIDQTEFLARSRPASGIIGAAVRHATVRSVVLFKQGKPLVVGEYAGKVDLQVVHPDLPSVGGRPGWLAAMGRTPTRVPAHLLPRHGTRLVQAFVAGDGADAIPVDQLLVTAGAPAPMLMLPRAPVRYATQDAPAG